VHPGKAIFYDTYYGYTGGPNANTLITPMSVSHPQRARVTYAVSTVGTEQTGGFDINLTTTWAAGTTFLNSFSATNLLAGQVNHLGAVYQSNIVTVPPTADGFFTEFDVGSNAIKTVTETIEYFCTAGTNVGGEAPACCTASDPVTQQTLQNILDMVTLLQRQTAPFAYVTGTAHSGLTGTGTVAVQGILGLLLNISIPARSGLEVGTPDTSFDVGWINFGTADGYTDRVFLRSDSQLVYPPVPGQYTIVGYTLQPSVSMTLTELRREP
jgi:hypothetical protein